MLVEKIIARGHVNVRSNHGTTFEVTKETHLTPRGDCIVAVCADRALPDFSTGFKEALRKPDSVLHITVRCGGLEEKIVAHGRSDLILTHPTDLVVRKSNFICSRTLGVCADKAAADFDRKLVEKLREDLPVEVELRVVLG
jgi:hypothetical protein